MRRDSRKEDEEEEEEEENKEKKKMAIIPRQTCLFGSLPHVLLHSSSLSRARPVLASNGDDDDDDVDDIDDVDDDDDNDDDDNDDDDDDVDDVDDDNDDEDDKREQLKRGNTGMPVLDLCPHTQSINHRLTSKATPLPRKSNYQIFLELHCKFDIRIYRVSQSNVSTHDYYEIQ
ncbi:hypothetical protein HZH66_000715 [Vespula vulgaris]|uniref:Uncharacterized protein n=1 Tax=Vespula vulgaris TaxID=7454 RepID=A0A834KPL5_VESVU|nr:hypothetical protein HZH66_000715 [Vespula vulgaris]